MGSRSTLLLLSALGASSPAAVASNEPQQSLRCDAIIADSSVCLISDISCLDGPAACGRVEGVEVIVFHLLGRRLWQDRTQSVFHRLFLISGIGNGSRHEEKTGLESEASVGVRNLPRRFTPSPEWLTAAP